MFPAEYVLSPDDAAATANELAELIVRSGVEPSLAITSLARPTLTAAERRASGAFYTDFRLASHLAEQLAKEAGQAPLILDPASGTGILLVAFVLAQCGSDPKARAAMVRDCVCAADLSADALRGARAALASLTDDLDAVRHLAGRLRQQDSLLVGAEGWSDVSPNGFGALIGNPPWEKLKLSRHEHLRAGGQDRHYGADYDARDADIRALEAERDRLAAYAGELGQLYPLSACGEQDLYKAFVELTLSLAATGGAIGLLIPAGLIRSLSTFGLRRHLFEAFGEATISVFENRARFFEIDTRFKFLALTGTLGAAGDPAEHRITLTHNHGTMTGVVENGRATVTLGKLRWMRADLTFPEVRSQDEWDLFERLKETGLAIGIPDSPWKPEIVREVDMTRDRPGFRRSSAGGAVPLIEGRMVHQFRSAAKSYSTGTGRRALWEVNPLGVSGADPQFFLHPNDLPPAAAARLSERRVGFCDVTGQTNERTVLASIIEPGVACGNKVPTILLPGAGDDEEALYTWVAVANSLVFDWLARRIVTTTLNYFLLESLPFPRFTPDSLPARRVADISRQVMAAEAAGDADLWELGQLRAELDLRVAVAYGIGFNDLELVLDDFPLLDRGQPPLEGEARSTVTRDVLLARAAAHFGITSGHARRAASARSLGALPYVPSSFADVLAPAPPDRAPQQRIKV